MYRTALILLSFTFYSALCCHPVPKTNIEIFEQIISSGLDKYYYYPGVNRNNMFIFAVKTDEKEGEQGSEIGFLKSIIKKTAAQNKLNFSFSAGTVKTDSAYNLLALQVIRFETKYPGFKKNTFLGSKTIIRNIIVKIAAELKTSDGSVNLKDSINSLAADEVDFDKYKQFESSDYKFTAGAAPLVSTFESVFFPVLVICVTAAATILFFAIRSK